MSIVSLYGSAYETLDTSLFQHFLLCSYFVYYSLPISYVAKQVCLYIDVFHCQQYRTYPTHMHKLKSDWNDSSEA